MLERVDHLRYQAELPSLYRMCVLANLSAPERCRAAEQGNRSSFAETSGVSHREVTTAPLVVGSHREKAHSPRQGSAQHAQHAHSSWEHLRSVDPAVEAELWEMAQRYGYGREPPNPVMHHRAYS